MSGCIEPKVLVSLKKSIHETINSGGSSNPPVNHSNALLSATQFGFCLTEASSDLCWGKRYSSEVVVPYAKELTSYPAGESVLYGKTIKKMSMGKDVTCAIASDDKLYCWGDNYYGTLGAGNTDNYTVPVAVNTSGVLSGKTIIDVNVYGPTACALDSDHRAYCWGKNDNGQTGSGVASAYISSPVAVNSGAVDFKEIVMGQNHVCAVSTSDTLYCWGDNAYGQLGDGSVTDSPLPSEVDLSSIGLTSVKSLKSSSDGICIIGSDDKVYCWGGLGSSITIPELMDNGDMVGKTAKTLYMSDTLICVIANDNFGYCNGANTYGQLGIGNATQPLVFKAIVKTGDLASGFKQISASLFNVCALSLSGKVYCWGNGGVGDGASDVAGIFSVVRSPVAVDTSGVLNGVVIDRIMTGSKTTCAIDTNSEMYCWGPEGARGDGVIGNYVINTPVSILKTGGLSGKTIKNVESNFAATCVIASDDQIYCWGNYVNNLATGKYYDQLTPKRIYSPDMSNQEITNIVFKYRDTDGNVCVQRSNGDVYCMDSTYNKMFYNFSMGSEIFSKVLYASSLDAYCGITTSMKVYCWGYSYGYFINHDVDSSQNPIQINMSGVLSGKTIEDLIVGETGFACVLADGLPYCWGSNSNGELGNGTFTESRNPALASTAGVLNGKTIKSLTTSNGTVCAVANDNRVYCWGTEIGLGNGAHSGNENTPSEVQLPAGETVKKIVMHNLNACVITDSKKLYCWGAGANGILGAGVAANSFVPVEISLPNSMTVTSVSINNETACALGSDSRAYCWGKGSLGQMGNGANAVNNTPVAVNLPSGVELQSIIVHSASVCALASDSKVYCWGENTGNQLGNNSTVNSNLPVEVQYTP